jgi:hypothetical protein
MGELTSVESLDNVARAWLLIQRKLPLGKALNLTGQPARVVVFLFEIFDSRVSDFRCCFEDKTVLVPVDYLVVDPLPRRRSKRDGDFG